jgi:hypothetical protein
MPFQRIIEIANPSDYERNDYVEVDLESLNVPSDLDGTTLRLSRRWPGGSCEEVPYQIDYPFGKDAHYRVLTFFSRATPLGDPDYKYHTAEFLLEEGKPGDWSASVRRDKLWIEHYSEPGVYERDWPAGQRITGVKLGNGGPFKPDNHTVPEYSGLQVYFSLVPRPEFNSPTNYAGAATNILHHRAYKRTTAGEFLAATDLDWPTAPEKCWGQLTHIDFYTLPWERRWYQSHSLLGQPGQEPEYTLAWSQSGPLRATVTLKSQPIHVQYVGSPFFQPDNKEVTCCLYRIISLYAEKEFYTERLTVRAEGEGVPQHERVSLAFRAHYHSFVDYPAEVPPLLNRLEHIPDYFAVWRDFCAEHRGYAFAADSHIRTIQVEGSVINWRLQLGHDHYTVHFFPFHCLGDGHQPFSGGSWPIDRLHEVGHAAWYEVCYKPLQAIPLNRYLVPR